MIAYLKLNLARLLHAFRPTLKDSRYLPLKTLGEHQIAVGKLHGGVEP